MTTNLEALVLVDEMRARGVQSFTVGAVSATFFPAEPKAAPQSKPVDEDMCKCGHSKSTEHMGGLCVMAGCDPRTCSPEAEK